MNCSERGDKVVCVGGVVDDVTVATDGGDWHDDGWEEDDWDAGDDAVVSAAIDVDGGVDSVVDGWIGGLRVSWLPSLFKASWSVDNPPIDDGDCGDPVGVVSLVDKDDR